MTNSDRRFVLDTNIIVSAAFFPNGLPCQAMDWAAQQGKILTSESAFAELAAVLLRPRFAKFASVAEREIFLEKFVSRAEFVEIDETIALAINGKAECIVTGDEDLLVLHPFRSIPILTARRFLEKVL
jgi:uncharacterized protein